MKLSLSVLFCLCALAGFSANPSFQSFNTNQFGTNGNVIVIGPSAKLTNTTLEGANFSDVSTGTTNSGGTWFGWGTFSNGGFALPAFNSPGQTPSLSAHGITFFLPNGTVVGGLNVQGNHNGTNVSEVDLTGATSIHIMPTANSGVGLGTLLLLQTGGSDIAYIQYAAADAISTVGTNDGITTYPFGHSQGLGFVAQGTNVGSGIIYSVPGIVGVGGTNATFNDSLVGNFGEGELWFYTHVPEPSSFSPLRNVAIGQRMGRMRTNGWDFNGNIVQQKAYSVGTNSVPLDFASLGQAIDLSLGSPGTVTFYTTNTTGTATNFEERTFIIRAGALNPTLSWPTWSVIGTNLGSIPPAMVAGQMLVLKLSSIGSGESNKIAEAYLTTDRTYSIDPDAAAMMSYLTNTGGFTNTNAQITNSLNYLATSLKGNNQIGYNFWTNIDALYPFVGGMSNMHAINMRNPNSMKIVWTGGLAGAGGHTTNGIVGNATTSFGNTMTNMNAYTNAAYKLNSAHVFCYITVVPTAGAFFGAFPDGNDNVSANTPNVNTFRSTGINDSAGSPINDLVFTVNGPAMITTTNATTHQAYIQNIIGTNVRTAGSVTTVPCFILARNTGAAGNFCDATLGGFSIGGGMSQGQWNEYRRIWDNFEAMLSRKAP